MKRPISWVAVVAVALGVAWQLVGRDAGQAGEGYGELIATPEVASAARESAPAEVAALTSARPDPAREAFEQGARDRMMRVEGRVERILADDRDGSPHQRFIIRTVSGISLLIAHNLDLAPRLDGLAQGDTVVAYGEYEWNDRGGVLHWTHDDPAGRHEAGYIEWRGRRFQ